MAHSTVMIGSDGAVVDLAVTIGLSRQEQLAMLNRPVPQPLTLRALIDTGADLSTIHPQVLRQLGVNRVGSIRFRGPGPAGGQQLAGLFEVQLSIGGIIPGSPWIPLEVGGVAPATPTVLALIGRDLLERCTLFHNGPRGELTLSS